MSNLPNPILQVNPNPPTGGPVSHKNDIQTPGVNPPSQVTAGMGIQKEQEPLGTIDAGEVEEAGSEIELSPELKAIGLEKRSVTIELPPDLRKMGISAVGPSQPVAPVTTFRLPLSDDQIVVGLQAQIVTSLRWLSEWCIKQLKRAHIHLRNVKGRIVRKSDF